MCGIVGIVNLGTDQAVSADLLLRMADTMEHRGPDDRGVWVPSHGQVGFAHRRLSIVDTTAAGHQPMSTPDGKVWVTFNGEIYNYKELKRDLESRGCVFRSNSDTEVLPYLYRVYGRKFFERLDGDFAIGLWDEDARRLVLARDRAGVKPLYYALVGRRLVFASEVRAILRHPGVAREIDPEAFYHYLTYLVAPPPRTLICGIRKLAAASALVIDSGTGGEAEPFKYWEPFPRVDLATSWADFDDELDHLYNRSVQKRLMSDVPVGALFSGGVDSTLNVTSFSKLIAPRKVSTFTVGMDSAAGFHDDATVAREMAARLGTDHHEIRISDADLLNASAKLASMQDEPVSDPVGIPIYFVTKLAKECGVTVVHAGEGADELFCGYNNYRNMLRRQRTMWRPLSVLPRSFSRIASGLAVVGHRSPRMRKIRDVLNRRAKGQELFMSSAIAYYEQEKRAVLSPQFRERTREIDSFGVVASLYERLRKESPGASFLQTMTFIELQLRLPELLLMRADKMAMANAVELRVPFLDRDLLEFALRVPDEYKLRDGISKEPLKRLASKYVDRESIYRPKTGFGVPIQHWFRGDLGAAFSELMASDQSEISLMVNKPEIQARLQRGPRTVNEAFQLWVIYNVLVWTSTLRTV